MCSLQVYIDSEYVQSLYSSNSYFYITGFHRLNNHTFFIKWLQKIIYNYIMLVKSIHQNIFLEVQGTAQCVLLPEPNRFLSSLRYFSLYFITLGF